MQAKLTQHAANCATITLPNGNALFFSYETPVACCIRGEGWTRTSQQYSATTASHLRKHLHAGIVSVVPPESFARELERCCSMNLIPHRVAE
jgi:hypothetical protein